MASSAQAKAPRSEHLLSIGQVLAQLNAEVPGPLAVEAALPRGAQARRRRRAPSPGYRKFSPADARAAARPCSTMQRDHYLPLKVIRDYLADLDAGRDAGPARRHRAAAPSILAGERRLPTRRADPGGGRRRRCCSATRSAGVAHRRRRHVRRRRPRGAASRLSRCAALGIEPRHLRGFRAAARARGRAHRTALASVLAPERREQPAPRAAELAREMARQLDVVRVEPHAVSARRAPFRVRLPPRHARACHCRARGAWVRVGLISEELTPRVQREG